MLPGVTDIVVLVPDDVAAGVAEGSAEGTAEGVEAVGVSPVGVPVEAFTSGFGSSPAGVTGVVLPLLHAPRLSKTKRSVIDRFIVWFLYSAGLSLAAHELLE